MKSSSLWVACLALASMACAGAKAGKPGVESLLAESRAALVAMEPGQALELAEQAERLYPDSKSAKSWAAQLREGDGPWRPPGPSQPAPAPGPHVVPGALLFVSAPALPLMQKPAASGKGLDSLPLNAAVSVLAVEGNWARVTRIKTLSGLLTPGAPPRWHGVAPDSPGDTPVGYVPARFLEPAPVDPGALRKQVRALLDAGSRHQALAAMERLLTAEPGDRELARELHRLALELEHIPAAARAAWTFYEERSSDPSLSLAPVLLYGCRGNVQAAEAQSEAEADSEAPDACVADVDVTPVKPELSLAVCSSPEGLSDEEQLVRNTDAQERTERERIRYVQEQEAYEARLSKLRERYPQGPYLCVLVSHTGERASWNVPVQLYFMPAFGAQCSTAGDEPEFEAGPEVSKLVLDELRLPYVAPGDALEVCRQVPRYEDAFFGAVAAPDVKAAKDFIRRREAAQAEVLDNPRSRQRRQLKEAVEAISSELPHVQLSTAFAPNCNLDCY